MKMVARPRDEKRDLPLEALRGLAALIVVVWHFLLAFDTRLLADPHFGIAGYPSYAFVHGTGAVCIFFVLSGYVLTVRYFETGERRILIVGALKRWLRLFLPVFLSVMVSWILFHYELYSFQEAGRISQSQWLATFGFSTIPTFDPSFGAALGYALTEAVHHDPASFNPLLWTIHIELIGSYLAFAFAALIAALQNNRWMVLLAFVLIAVTTHFIEPFLFPFLLGTVLACYRHYLRFLSSLAYAGSLVLGILFLGFHDPIAFYSPFWFLDPVGETLRAYTSSIGAAFVMVSFIGFEPLRRLFGGWIALILGRMSFPIYLVHIILIASVGSYVFAVAAATNSYFATLMMTATILIPCILLAAAIFAVIDLRWVAFVNRLFSSVHVRD